MSDSSSSPHDRPKVPKLGHKKSRTGCQRCKQRRVKCDEKKPKCSICVRHNAECNYGMAIRIVPQYFAEQSDTSTEPRTIGYTGSSTPSSTGRVWRGHFPDLRMVFNIDSPTFAENQTRRLIELRLMQNTFEHPVYGPPTTTPSTDAWKQLIKPMVASAMLEVESVQYAVLALSAAHLLRSTPRDPTLLHVRRFYYTAALKAQRQQCARLSKDNLPGVCMASIVILQYSLSKMMEHPDDILSLCVDWLRLGAGVSVILAQAAEMDIPPDQQGIRLILHLRARALQNQDLEPTLDEPFRSVISTIAETQSNKDDILALKRTMRLIEDMQDCINYGWPTYIIGRRLYAFSATVPARFPALVAARDPGALVVLAYLLGVAAEIQEDFWSLRGNVGEPNSIREQLRVVGECVPEKLKVLLEWPLKMAMEGKRVSGLGEVGIRVPG